MVVTFLIMITACFCFNLLFYLLTWFVLGRKMIEFLKEELKSLWKD
ncbi:hypothetical protein MVQ18_08800 [Fusobacterium necrophorum]|nr:hypothetical protein [Fusobacterium necrophorum]MDK4516838.1 hypothetical protein [Fusobacterium necrophorum]